MTLCRVRSTRWLCGKNMKTPVNPKWSEAMQEMHDRSNQDVGQTTKDFVVISGGQPYRIRAMSDGHWINRLTAAKQWVTVRQAGAVEVEMLWEDRLKPEHAKLYEMGLPYLAA